MITIDNQLAIEKLSTDDVFGELSDRFSVMGTEERQNYVREMLQNLVEVTQGTVEEEIYLRALRGMRNR